MRLVQRRKFRQRSDLNPSVGGLVSLLLVLLTACNNDVPVPASVEFSADQVRLTITRVATHPFLSRHDLRLTLAGPGGCSIEAELFPNTGYVSRRNLYLTRAGLLYVVGQFDARVIDPLHCTITLAEFRTLDRYVTFLGSFDENEQKRWTYFPASQRPELPFEKR
jgi:hypothetical protein